MTDLPAGWQSVPLGEISSSIRKTATIERGVEYELWSVPSFAAGTPEVVLGSTVKSGKLAVRESDVLICKINPRINRVWVVGPDKGRPQVASTEWIVARISDRSTVSPAYLRAYCQSPDFRASITESVSGVTGSHTRAKPDAIMRHAIPLPSQSEQAEIVRILDTQLARIDTVLRSVQAVRDKADQFRRSLLHAAFTGQLTQPDPSRGDALPEGWGTSTLGAVARWGSGGTPKAGVASYYGGDIPWAVIGDLSDGVVCSTKGSITEDGLLNSSAKVVEPGTLLVAMYGSIGKLGIAGMRLATNQAIAFATPIKNVTTTSFLFRYVEGQRDSLARSGKGATQQNISQTILKAWPAPLPPVEEQDEIVRILDTQLARLDKALEVADRVEVECGRLRRSLLQAAFTGELTRKWRESRG